MSDHDRGAYTPQTDAPLAFDARAPRGGRKPLPMALIGSGVVLLVLVAGIGMYYRSGVRPAGGPRLVNKGRTLVFRTRPVRRDYAVAQAIVPIRNEPAQQASDAATAELATELIAVKASASGARLGQALHLPANLPPLDTREAAGGLPLPIV